MIRFRFIRLCFLVLISNVIAHAAKSSLEKCWNSTLPINRIKFDIKSRTTVKVLPDGNVKVYTLVNWTLSGANDSEFDGYLIRLRNTITYAAIPPLNDCEASQSHLWIQTNNATDCSVSNLTTYTTCSVKANHNNYCVCDVKLCPFVNRSRCKPSTDQMNPRLRKFRSIPSTKRSMRFEIKYNTDYSLNLYPYFRQYLPQKVTDHRVAGLRNCAEDLSSILNISVVEAGVKCCENQVELLSPIDVQHRNVVLDERSRTFNISVSWIPPIMTALYYNTYPDLQTEQVYVSSLPEVTETSSIQTNGRNASCSSIRNSMQSLVAYNLLPNTSYTLRLTAIHTREENLKACRYGYCSKTIRLFADFCKAKGLFCVESASCNYNATTLVTSCKCKDGMIGDGVTSEYNGTGCSSCHALAGCHALALCEIANSTNETHQCRCDHDHYGDGLARGSGCTSEATQLTQMIVNIVCAVLLGIIVELGAVGML